MTTVSPTGTTAPTAAELRAHGLYIDLVPGQGHLLRREG